MNRTAILVVGTNHTIPRQDNRSITTVLTAEAAIEKIQQTDFDIVVLTTAVATEEKKLQRILSLQQPDAIVIKNSNIDLVAAEITAALQNRNKTTTTTYSFVDDGLKNAMLPISIQ